MVKIEVLGGKRSIGGNFVRVEDRNRVLIFDQGIRFDLMKRFYAGFIVPRGIREFRDIGVVPKAEWYDGVSDIYISHMHLDHLGLLSNIPGRTRVHLPSLAFYEALDERWRESPTWLSMIPRKYFVELKELKPLEADGEGVMPIPVSHSAFPSYALLYFGSDETILYTGDFRMESFLGKDGLQDLYGAVDILEYFNENSDVRVDKLVIEGTNLGSNRPPLSPAEEEAMFQRILNAHSLVVATIHPLDVEYAYFLAELADEMGREFYITTYDTIRLLEKISKLPGEPTQITDYTKAISRFKVADLTSIDENALILASYREVIDLMRDLGEEEILPSDSAAVLSEPEPQMEEAQEYDTIMNWLARLKTQAYSMRLSGHYYPYQLKTIIQKVKPKEIIPIHTLYPEWLYTIQKIT